MAKSRMPHYQDFVDGLTELVARTGVVPIEQPLRLGPVDKTYPDRRTAIARWDETQQTWSVPDGTP